MVWSPISSDESDTSLGVENHQNMYVEGSHESPDSESHESPGSKPEPEPKRMKQSSLVVVDLTSEELEIISIPDEKGIGSQQYWKPVVSRYIQVVPPWRLPQPITQPPSGG